MIVLGILFMIGLSLIVFLNSFQKSAQSFQENELKKSAKKVPKKKPRTRS